MSHLHSLIVILLMLSPSDCFQARPAATPPVVASITPSRAGATRLSVNKNSADNNDDGHSVLVSRARWWNQVAQLLLLAATSSTISAKSPYNDAAVAFEGGIGGLGKTKPETGVTFLSPPTQEEKSGLVTAELLVGDTPLLVRWESPKWPLLATATGLEVRDLQHSESAFLQVIPVSKMVPLNKAVVTNVLVNDNILSARGKFGAYGSPTNLRVRQVDNNDLWDASFTTLTPGLRESDRRIFLKCVPCNNNNNNNNNWLVLVAGTTLQRFSKQEAALRRVVDSFQVIQAPATRLR